MDDLTLLCIGGAHVDRIGRVSTHYQAGASNPGTMRETIGGGMLNACRAAALADLSKIGFVSARGGDVAADAIGSAIETTGARDISGIFLDRSSASYTAIHDVTGEVAAALADTSIYETCLPRQLRRGMVRDAIARSQTVFLDANLPESALEAVATLASGLVAAMGISPQKVSRLLTIADRLDVVFMNEREAEALATSRETDVSRLFPRAVIVVTHAGRPVTLAEPGQAVRAIAVPPRPISGDVTGCGDALAGATIARKLKDPGCNWMDAVMDGIAAAMCALTVHGPLCEAEHWAGFPENRTAVKQINGYD